MKYLLDSVILIDHFNGITAATEFLREHGAARSLSVIIRAEVLAGFDASTEVMARELLDAFATLPITVDVTKRAAALRRTERWKLPDALQVAVALHFGLALVTRRTRDFQAGGEPEVLIPYHV